MRRLVISLALIAVLALPATAGAARARPLMTVTHFGGTPAQVEAGKAFRATVRVRNRGRAGGATRLVIRLRRQGVTRGLLVRRLAPLGPGKSRRIRLRVPVPGATAARAYALQACVRRRGLKGRNVCRTAPRRLTVTDPDAPPVDPPPLNPTPGSRTAGDALFPEIGNGGYNATRYVINLRYDPATNTFLSGTSTAMTARATKDLSQFSLDFEGLTVTGVRVAGKTATFNRVAPAACSPSPPAASCGETKLIVNPAEPIAEDQLFTVRVSYLGTPQEHTDPDSSIEGWIRACSTSGNPATCDGAFVVNQPIGAMTWFPSNNYPTDKALFRTAVTVPSTHKAIGVGEIESQVANGDGTTTWTWFEDDPTATYLTTATVGLFGLTTAPMVEDTTSQSLPVYTAIDSGCSPANTAASTLALSETPQIINFFNDYYGTYPFDSTGAVVDRTTGIGYALEVQTKPHYPSCTSTLRPTIVHELAHQWFGNTVTLATWSDIWFNEGWAQWSDWFHSAPGTATPAVAEANWQAEYNDGDDQKWEIAPAVLDGDPANLFATFPTYTRGAMTLEGYRQIVGDTKFFEFAQQLLSRYRYGNITTQQVIDLALEISDFTGPELAQLALYFDQWLYGTARPTITPANF